MRTSKQASADTERIWREQLQDLLDAGDLRSKSEQSLKDTFAAIAVLWIEVAVLVVGVNFVPRLPIWLAVPAGMALVLLMGTRVMALGVIVHEGSHGLLARSRKVNDALCNWGAALWTINSVEEYRPTHRLHHRYLGQEGDPDRSFYLVPAHRGALAKVVLQDLIGLTALRRAAGRISGTSQESAAPANLLARPQLLFGKLITQVVVLAQFILFQGIRRGFLFYVVFWLVPIVCVYPMILRLKTIVEHYDPRLHNSKIAYWTARSNSAGWIQNHVVGARMQFHFEHHIFPTIPYRGLRRLHRELDEAGLFTRHPEILSDGYVRFLARAIARKLGGSPDAFEAGIRTSEAG